MFRRTKMLRRTKHYGKHKLYLMIGNLFFLCSGISSLELITLENE